VNVDGKWQIYGKRSEKGKTKEKRKGDGRKIKKKRVTEGEPLVTRCGPGEYFIWNIYDSRLDKGESDGREPLVTRCGPGRQVMWQVYSNNLDKRKI